MKRARITTAPRKKSIRELLPSRNDHPAVAVLKTVLLTVIGGVGFIVIGLVWFYAIYFFILFGIAMGVLKMFDE